MKKILNCIAIMFIIAFTMECFTGCNINISTSYKTDSTDSSEEAQVSYGNGIPEYDSEGASQRDDFLCKYREDDNVGQVLLVTYTDENNATAQFYEKIPEENNTWSLVFESDAYIGLDGVGECNEFVCVTPLGDFGVKEAFGIKSNPGTQLTYIDVKPTTYACSDDCEYYNTIIDIEETGHDCEGEEMYRYSPDYNYGLVIDYNSECIYPDGSNIYIHCKGTEPYTGACIALDEEDMVTILRCAESGMRVLISKYY